MSKFTTGPWTHQIVDDDDDYYRYGHEVLGAWKNGVRFCVADVQNMDDARLIAAAPTYYEAGVEFRAYEAELSAGDDVAAMNHYARASQLLADAHAKATGEQP